MSELGSKFREKEREMERSAAGGGDGRQRWGMMAAAVAGSEKWELLSHQIRMMEMKWVLICVCYFDCWARKY